MGVGLLIFYVANVANVSNVRPSKDPPCPSLKGRELFSPPCPDQSGLKIRPHRNYWAYLTNKWQKNVVPLHRISKTTAPARVRPDQSGLKIRPPVLIGNTLPTNGKNM